MSGSAYVLEVPIGGGAGAVVSDGPVDGSGADEDALSEQASGGGRRRARRPSVDAFLDSETPGSPVTRRRAVTRRPVCPPDGVAGARSRSRRPPRPRPPAPWRFPAVPGGGVGGRPRALVAVRVTVLPRAPSSWPASMARGPRPSVRAWAGPCLRRACPRRAADVRDTVVNSTRCRPRCPRRQLRRLPTSPRPARAPNRPGVAAALWPPRTSAPPHRRQPPFRVRPAAGGGGPGVGGYAGDGAGACARSRTGPGTNTNTGTGCRVGADSRAGAGSGSGLGCGSGAGSGSGNGSC